MRRLATLKEGWETGIQSVTGPHRQNDRDDRPCREDHFCKETYTRKHVIPELCACIKVRAPRTGTN